MSSVRWDRVDALIDASPGLPDLRAHGLALLAAQRCTALGRPLPAGLVREQLQATWRTNAAPRVLELVRAACEGPILLMKGPAVAAHYPDPNTRPFIDLDLMVPDAQTAQASLLSAGFVLSADPAGYPDYLHHLPPVHSPKWPLPIEVHSRLKWLDGMPAPGFDLLASSAVDGALGVHGILVPSPARHALVLAAHLWAHDPLARLLRLLDIAVLAQACDAHEIASLARAWRMSRLWRATANVADALFGTASSDPWPLRTWGHGLRDGRELTIVELHLSRLLSPFAIHTPKPGSRALAAAIAGFARPHEGEPWRRKLERTTQQLARPSMRRSEHRCAIDAERRQDGSD